MLFIYAAVVFNPRADCLTFMKAGFDARFQTLFDGVKNPNENRFKFMDGDSIPDHGIDSRAT